MARVKTNQRVKRRAKQIRANGQVILVNQLLPFQAGCRQELEAETDRYDPPELKPAQRILRKCVLGQVNRQAA
jgi:hypothetical protein